MSFRQAIGKVRGVTRLENFFLHHVDVIRDPMKFKGLLFRPEKRVTCPRILVARLTDRSRIDQDVLVPKHVSIRRKVLAQQDLGITIRSINQKGRVSMS